MPQTPTLAQRLKAALQAEEDKLRAQSEAQLRETRRTATRKLMGDLETFARDVGYLALVPTDDDLTLVWRGRTLTFHPDPEAAAVRVTATDAEVSGTVYLEASGRWSLEMVGTEGSAGSILLKMPFFDDGLEILLVRALGVPVPEVAEPDFAAPSDLDLSEGSPDPSDDPDDLDPESPTGFVLVDTPEAAPTDVAADVATPDAPAVGQETAPDAPASAPAPDASPTDPTSPGEPADGPEQQGTGTPAEPFAAPADLEEATNERSRLEVREDRAFDRGAYTSGLDRRGDTSRTTPGPRVRDLGDDWF